MRRRGAVFWVVLGLGLLAVGYVFGGRGSTGQPLDPDGTDGIGTRALVLLLEEYGVTVRRDDGVPQPGDDTDVALVLTDQLDDAAWDEMRRWAEAGGSVVQIDPGSPLAPGGTPAIRTGRLPSGRCDIPSLAGLELEAPTFQLLDASGASARCFGDDDHALVHVANQGDGRVVSLGTAVVLTNEYLDQGDNAALAATLLLPDAATGPGDPAGDGGTVRVLYQPIVTPGSGRMLDEVPSGVRWAGIQLLVAFVLLVWWQGRRFGLPVNEPQPVELPGSLLMRAKAELLRRSGSHHRAGLVLRQHTERRVRRHLSAPSDTPPDILVEELVAREGVDREAARSALIGPPVTDGRGLTALVAAIDRVATVLEATETLPEPDRHQRSEPSPEPDLDRPADPADDDQHVPTGAAS